MKALTIKGIPTEVLRRYKAICSLRGVSMNDALIAHMMAEGEAMKAVEEKDKK